MKRRMVSVLATVAALGAALVGIAPPASAATGAVVCAVAGTMNVSEGYRYHPAGGWAFDTIVFVCVGANDSPLPPPAGAGTMTGVGMLNAAGQFGVGNCGGVAAPALGSFCGTYDANLFTLGGECHGNVGGDQGAHLADITSREHVLRGDWSLVTGPLLLGGMTCNSGSYAGGWGAIALVGVPNPLALDGEVLGNDLPPGDCAPPSYTVPTRDGVWACQLVLAGVIVMQSVV
ncbi:MAG TPA: hypothetical protein VF230_16870 [Acidimicrobiales bacterium]